MKLVQITLPLQACGRLQNAIRHSLPDLPEYLIRAAFRRRDVKMNGIRVKPDALCIGGAQVQIYLPDYQPADIPVLFGDDCILIVHKPSGMACEQDEHGQTPLPQLLIDQLSKQPDPPKELILCHRLDYYTEGLLVLAKDRGTADQLLEAFREHRVHKRYECLVKGTPNPPHARLEAYLVKDAQKALVTVFREYRPGAVRISTEYQVLEPGKVSRLSVLLHTGRTHQIRAHLASIGHPIIGDDKYGDRELNKSLHVTQPRLCAVELRFDLTGDLAYLNGQTFKTQPHF